MCRRHAPIHRRIASALLIGLLSAASPSGMTAQQPLSNPEGALQWWIDNAETGSADYQYNLGRMYETGMPAMNLPADAERARQWYQRAAAQGHVAAQSALAQLRDRRVDTTTADRRAITPTPQFDTTSTTPTADVARYWPWWQGGLALAAIALGFWLALGAPLGVSSSWDRIVSARAYRRAEAADRQLAQHDAGAVTDALLAETLRQFGPAALAQLKVAEGRTLSRPAPKPTQLSWTAHVTFLASLALGGLVAAMSTETFTLKPSLGDAFTHTIGDGWTAGIVLVLGGVLIGFGTRMAGGCTSGHGLTGCARLQPGSLLATASFFGSAALLTLFMVHLL